ncbi:hypothetical protein BC827DRAFT_902417 [Russula dissimulans]|nr:hypothetical protein BC827DRAFT_902417 [Russula dissimulans]
MRFFRGTRVRVAGPSPGVCRSQAVASSRGTCHCGSRKVKLLALIAARDAFIAHITNCFHIWKTPIIYDDRCPPKPRGIVERSAPRVPCAARLVSELSFLHRLSSTIVRACFCQTQPLSRYINTRADEDDYIVTEGSTLAVDSSRSGLPGPQGVQTLSGGSIDTTHSRRITRGKVCTVYRCQSTRRCITTGIFHQDGVHVTLFLWLFVTLGVAGKLDR